MNRRRAKREACSVVAMLVQSYMSVGQPLVDCEEGSHGWHEVDAPNLEAAFLEIVDEMQRRGRTTEDDR